MFNLFVYLCSYLFLRSGHFLLGLLVVRYKPLLKYNVFKTSYVSLSFHHFLSVNAYISFINRM